MSNILKGLNEQTAFEGTFILTESRTYKLWESAGQKLMEAQLTQAQISQIFQWVEDDMIAGGNNRTMIGKGKDVADTAIAKGKDVAGKAITKGKEATTAVMSAWEELKDKVQTSGPIKNLDAQYDKAAEQLKQATGGDQGVMQYVQKYRDFAKKHPIAQSLIYSALIAAAGISGAGLGGAAALGLFKMVDKLLQGEKFSSAAYSGAKTGAMAYAAGQIGQALKGGEIPTGPGMDSKFADVSGTMPDGTVLPTDSVASSIQSQMDILKDLGLPKDASYGQVVKAMKDQGWPSDWVSGTIQDAGRRAAASTASDVASNAVSQGLGAGTNAFKDPAVMNSLTKAASTGGREAVLAQINQVAPAMSQNAKQMMIDVAMKKAGLKESINLSESQIFFVIGSIVQKQQLQEGVMDTIKGGFNKAKASFNSVANRAVDKAANYMATKGKNITNKVTADKLLQAWKKAGSPTDSLDVASIIQRAGVSADIIKQVYADMKIPAPSGGSTDGRTIGVDPTSVTPTPPGQQTPQPNAQPQASATPPQGSSTPQPNSQPQSSATPQGQQTTQPGATTASAGNLKQIYAQARSLLDQLDDKGQERVVGALKNDLELAVAEDQLDENLHKWFKEKWVRFGPDGKIRGACARGDDSEGKPKCLPQAKAHALGKKGRKYAASKKRREDPNPERRGPAKNVATKKKSNEGAFDNNSPMTKETMTQDKIRSLKNLIDIAKEQGRGLRVQELEQALKKIQGELDEACWKGYHKEGNKEMFGKTYPNCVKNKKKKKANEAVEGSGQQLSVQQLATISDEALDKAYGYGRSTPGNSFGWQANLMSAAYAKKMIDAGVTDIEKISDAIHKGWNVTAQKFVQNPDQFDDTEKLRQAGKLDAKLQQRAKLMKINYAQLENDEQEKDRVVARALLQAITGQQGVAEGSINEFAPAGSGNGNTPRGPRTPGRGPWDDNDNDPYQSRRYNRSIDFFDQFDIEGFDKQKFDKNTGEFEGYYLDRDAPSGITQIAYFKFDDPTKIGDNDSGMGWYYEPVDEGSLNEFAPTDDGDTGEEDTLFKFAKLWYNGNNIVQQKVEAVLAQAGWEIGELESEEGGAFIVKAGDENGDSYIGFTARDLTDNTNEDYLDE